MERKSVWFLAVFLLLSGAFLVGSWSSPSPVRAYDLPGPVGPPVAISAAGDSAWAIVGNRVYYVSLRTRSEVPGRTINVIGSKDLN